MPGYTPNTTTNVAAAYTPTAPGYSGPGNTGSTYTSGSGGGGGNSTYTPQMTGYNPSTGGVNRPGNNQYTPNLPQVPVVGKDIANPNYTPQNPKGPAAYTPTAPGYNGPGGPGGGSGGGGRPVHRWRTAASSPDLRRLHRKRPSGPGAARSAGSDRLLSRVNQHGCGRG